MFAFSEPAKFGVLDHQPVLGWVNLLLSCVFGVGIGWAGLLAQFYISATSMIGVLFWLLEMAMTLRTQLPVMVTILRWFLLTL